MIQWYKYNMPILDMNKYLYQPNQRFNTSTTYYITSLLNLLFALCDQGPKLNSITLYYTISAPTKWIK